MFAVQPMVFEGRQQISASTKFAFADHILPSPTAGASCGAATGQRVPRATGLGPPPSCSSRTRDTHIILSQHSRLHLSTPKLSSVLQLFPRREAATFIWRSIRVFGISLRHPGMLETGYSGRARATHMDWVRWWRVLTRQPIWNVFGSALHFMIPLDVGERIWWWRWKVTSHQHHSPRRPFYFTLGMERLESVMLARGS